MKKIIILLLIAALTFTFCEAAFAASDFSFDSMTSKDWAGLAKQLMRKVKSSSDSDEEGSSLFGKGGVDINKIIQIVNTIRENGGSFDGLIGDESAQTGVAQSAAVSAINSATFKLYAELAKSGGNLFFSPYSISTAMAMVYAGARGATAAEIQQLFGFNAQIHTSMSSLMSQLDSISVDIAQLHTANALWPAADKNILSDYRNRVARDYKAEITTLDFANTEQARGVINKWVAGKTQGKIQNIVGPGAISKTTPLCVTNAVYFKADWQSKFEKQATSKAVFFAKNGVTVKTDFMNQTGAFDYLQSGDVEILELPYKAERLSMYILLPASGKFDLVEKSLTPEQLDSFIAQAAKTKLCVSVPKFKLEESYNLNDTFKKLGMTSAFTSDANFSGMDGLLDISIGTVLHRAFLDVNETGTEAAAATFVGMKAMATAEKPKEFKADRPFIFVIRDNTTGANLFIGRYMKP